ncbi:MAG: leucine-rich repeat domain-containing protein [Lachnospiraceae bacterium]|nr:leucine-rich repeat domain-containing protein [Lachnospiraceae bacterium]
MEIFKRYEGTKEFYRVEDGVTTIMDNAFYDKGFLIELTLPESVDSIGDYAFKLCFKLTHITLPKKVRHFGTGVFQQCHGLKKVDLPYGVEKIDSGMFLSCTSMEELTIPSTVKEIDPSAFAVCRSLERIHCDDRVFSLIPEGKKLAAAMTYLKDENEDGEEAYSYLSSREEEALDWMLQQKEEGIFRKLLSKCDYSIVQKERLMDCCRSRGREDLSGVILDSQKNIQKEDPFDMDPFA